MMFNSEDLTGMRTAQQGHMMDTCVIVTYSEAKNSFNEMVPSYNDGATSACGLDMRPGIERHNPDNTILEYDAVIRLPITTTMDPRNRIRITHRFGEALSPTLTYEVVGPIQRGPSGIRLLLKKVET